MITVRELIRQLSLVPQDLEISVYQAQEGADSADIAAIDVYDNELVIELGDK